MNTTYIYEDNLSRAVFTNYYILNTSINTTPQFLYWEEKGYKKQGFTVLKRKEIQWH
jgi:hypothetical protein